MVFSIQEYLDKEFMNIQEFMKSLDPALPFVDIKKIKDEKQLIKALVTQNKAYSRQIITLVETLAKGSAVKGPTPEEKKKSLSPSQKERQIHKQKERLNSPPQKDEPTKAGDTRIHLERKIEYLNSLVMEEKRKLEEKEYDYNQLKHKHEQLVEEYKKVVQEKEKTDNDLQELIHEYSDFRQKYEAKFQEVVSSKDSQIAELKRKLELRGLSPAKGAERISERDEELEELRDRLEQKEKLIAELRERTQNQRFSHKDPQHPDLGALNERVHQLGIKLEDFYVLFSQICRRLGVNIEGDKNFTKRFEYEDHSIESLARIINHEYILRVEALKLYADRVLDKLTDRADRLSIKDQVIDTSLTRTPMRPSTNNPVKENIHVVKDEIQETLKTTFTNFEKITKEELYEQLQNEIDKNVELQKKIENFNRLIHKMIFIIQEETERLSWVYEYSTQISNVQEFRGQLESCKRRLSELIDKHNITNPNVNLSAEYANQKLQWEEKISHQIQVFQQETSKLRTQFEHEKMTLEKTNDKLKQEKDRIKEEMASAEKFFKGEIEKHMKKVLELEGINMDLSQQVNELKGSNASLERRLNERENTIHQNSSTIAQLQKKYTLLENDHNATQALLTKAKNSLAEKEREVDGLTRENKRIEEDRKALKEQIEKLQSRMRETEQVLEHERRQLREAHDELTREYKKYVEEAERHTKEIKDNAERMIRDYSNQIEDLKATLESTKRTHQKQLKMKEDEIQQLEELKRTNAEALRYKEAKISELSEELRYTINNSFLKHIRTYSNKVINLERDVSEMNSLKEKNKKYVELLQASNNELNNLKLEVQTLIHEKGDFSNKCLKLEREYNMMREELKKYQDKYNEYHDIAEQSKAEIKILKHELDIAHEKIALQAREAKQQEEASLAQSQSQISYKDEVISKLKSDLKNITSEYELVKKEYQRIIERNEEILMENRKLRKVVKEHSLELEINLSNEKIYGPGDRLREELLRQDRASELGYSGQKKVRDFESLIAKGDNLQK